MKIGRIISSLAVIASLALTFATPVFAADATEVTADTKKDGKSSNNYGGGSGSTYATEGGLQNGLIVQLAKKDKYVEPAKQASLSSMYGVTVDRNKLSITVSQEGLPNEVYVATSGTYDVLVSTQGGKVAIGDYLTISSIDGVAMKAGTDESTVFGRAAKAYDGKTNTLSTTALKDKSGKTLQTVTIGSVPVVIDIKKNPNDVSTKTNVPKPLQRLGQAIAEKPVSPIRIYLSIFITGISLIAAIVILYGGVRNSLISIGRNPMAKKSIGRALFEIILTSVIVLVVGLFAVYLLLKL